MAGSASCSSKRIDNANPEVGEVGCDRVFEALPNKSEQEATERTENVSVVFSLLPLLSPVLLFGPSDAVVSNRVNRRARYSRINGIFALAMRLTALSRSALTSGSMPYQISSGRFKSSASA